MGNMLFWLKKQQLPSVLGWYRPILKDVKNKLARRAIPRKWVGYDLTKVAKLTK